MPDGIVYADSPGSRGKLDAGGFTRCRINRSKEFADRRNHINGIGNFWNQAKRALRKYNGIDRKPFPPLLRECEFRFNFGTPSRQLKSCGIGVEFRDNLVQPQNKPIFNSRIAPPD
ncbi:IS1016 transposase [Neisseria gonorrhoeae]|uniref:IS1016 transposase n=1 Tax=Neisseria gonorrhoeae TaxID=485 RepID=A0A378VYI2_NEIGO|nr:IS1016 transposase [Neisseria gonorrhoeae]